MVATVELVMFAIQAAVRLAKTGRRIFVENTASRELVVPLPAALGNLFVTASDYANSLRLNGSPRFAAEFKIALDRCFDAALPKPDLEAAKQDLIELYLLDAGRGLVPTIRLDQCECAGLAAVKQWSDGESPFPHPLQRVAGALVEVAVDYFATVPGALNTNSRSGKTIKAFLLGLGQMDLNLEEARWDSIVVGLFTAGLDGLKENPDLLTDEDEKQGLIRQIVGGLTDDLKERLRQNPVGDLDAEADLARYGQIVLRSLLQHGGTAVVENPAVLGLRSDTGKALVSEVGSTFLSILLDGGDDLPFSKALASIASTATFDKLAKVALQAVSEHPELFHTGNVPVDDWLKKFLKDLYASWPAEMSFFDVDLFAHAAYVLLDAGLRELPSLLQADPGQKALLVSVAGQLLTAVTVPPDANHPARWHFALGRSDVEALLTGATVAVASHPSWVTKDPKAQQIVSAVLPSLVAGLGNTDSDLLKNLVRSGQWQPLLESLISSGLATELAGRDLKNFAPVIQHLQQAITAHGVAGLADVLTSGAAIDLGRALAGHAALDKLFGPDATRSKAVAASVAALVFDLRAGPPIAIPEMRQRLDAAVA